MGRFSEVTKGHRAIKRVRVPLVNVQATFSAAVPELDAQRARDGAGQTGHEAGVRVLTVGELAIVYEKAGKFARDRGVSEPNDTDPIYNLGYSVYLCAIAYVDPDSDVADPEPYFGSRGDVESAAAQIISSPHIGRDGIAYLAEQQEAWQGQVSPQTRHMPAHRLHELTEQLANEEAAERTFLGLGPGMRFLYVHSMAKLLSSSPTLRSLFGATSPESSSSGGNSGAAAPS